MEKETPRFFKFFFFRKVSKATPTEGALISRTQNQLINRLVPTTRTCRACVCSSILSLIYCPETPPGGDGCLLCVDDGIHIRWGDTE